MPRLWPEVSAISDPECRLYAAVGLGVEGTIPADMIAYGGWLTALGVDRSAIAEVFL